MLAHDESAAAGQLQLTVAPATGGDPCLDIGGATLTQSEGVISFIGDGDYEADALVCTQTHTRAPPRPQLHQLCLARSPCAAPASFLR